MPAFSTEERTQARADLARLGIVHPYGVKTEDAFALLGFFVIVLKIALCENRDAAAAAVRTALAMHEQWKVGAYPAPVDQAASPPVPLRMAFDQPSDEQLQRLVSHLREMV